MQTKIKKPPKIAEWFLYHTLDKNDRDFIVGDFAEIYAEIANKTGVLKASVWYWWQIIKSIPHFISNNVYWRIVMLRSYLKIAFRNIKKHKGYSLINVTGLVIGLACCILIFFWIHDELNYDRFHDNFNELCRIVRSERSPDGTISRFAGTSSPLGPSLKESYPEIIDFVRVYHYSRLQDNILLEYKNKKFYENAFSFSDPAFFTVFTFPFIHGNAETTLSKPNSVVITKEISEKYFGEGNPMGKTLKMLNYGDFTVSGVIQNIPANSHLQFDFISPISPLFEKYNWMKRWRIPHFYTYLLLDKKADIRIVDNKIRDHIKQIDPEMYKNSDLKYALQPLKDVHLRSNFKFDISGDSKPKLVYIALFSVIGVFVLIIACINFINLTTARSTKRAKEIGMRKAIGANRTDIARQFFGESLLISFLSLGLALILVFILLPAFNAMSGKQLQFIHLFNLNILLGIAGIATLTGLFSGLYPAILLSSFRPVSVLNGNKHPGTKGFRLKNLLVIIQFTLSLILIIGTIVVYSQLDYIQNKKLGYDKEHLFYFAKQGGLNMQYDTFKQALLKNTNILNVTTASDLPTYTRHLTLISGWEGSTSEDEMLMNFFSVDLDFIKTFGIEMVEGRDFSSAFLTDADGAFIINEKAVEQMGMEAPIGKRFSLWNNEGRIIGVMKNFHFKSLHNNIEPLIFWINPEWDRYVFVRMRSERLDEIIKFVGNVHHQFNPDYPFEFKFLDKDIDQLYHAERRMRQLLQIFAGLAILISCFGLLGLAAFMAEQRAKEIAIRKVLGATISNVTTLISQEFIKLVFISNVIAWPIAYYFMNNWLQDFAFRTNIGFLTFVFAGALTYAIAFLTVGYQAIKAATANPVDALKYE